MVGLLGAGKYNKKRHDKSKFNKQNAVIHVTLVN